MKNRKCREKVQDACEDIFKKRRNIERKHPTRKRAQEASKPPHKPKPTPRKNAPKRKRDEYNEQQKYNKPERHKNSPHNKNHFHDRNKSRAKDNNYHTFPN